MKRLAAALFSMVVIGSAAETRAADPSDQAIAGTYFLIQDDGFQRVISLNRGGIVNRLADQQIELGFTGGAGAWKEIEPGKVKATVIDFDYDLDSGARLGAAVTTYTLTFSEKVDGRYQEVAGEYTGKQYALGQNPFTPTAAPIRTYDIEFTGQRVTVD